MHTFHHVPHRSPAFIMDAGEPARREPGESGQGAGKGSAVSPDGAGADAGRIVLMVAGDGLALSPYP